MKLNLLPTTVSREKHVRNAVLLSVLIAAGSIAALIFMMTASQRELDRERRRAELLQQRAQEAVRVSAQADEILQRARGLILNINLAEAMINHNGVYPALYDEVRQYIPGFFRVQLMHATPAGPEQTVVRLDGVIQTYQQYADIMLAMLRVPTAQQVSRAGYQITDPFVPPLVPEDQVGRPVRPGEPRIPDDPWARFELMVATATPPGAFAGTGGFGTTFGEPATRGAMPGWSTITVGVLLQRNIQTPEPRGTLATAAGLWAGYVPPVPGQVPGAPPAPPATDPGDDR
jgi:hypothetical protein